MARSAYSSKGQFCHVLHGTKIVVTRHISVGGQGRLFVSLPLRDVPITHFPCRIDQSTRAS